MNESSRFSRFSFFSLPSAAALAALVASPSVSAWAQSGFRFEGDPVSFSINGAANVGLINSRCAENQLATNEEALARIDWADRCGYLSKAKWMPLFEGVTHPLTGVRTPRSKFAYPIFTQGADHKLWTPTSDACDMPEDVSFFGICEAGCYTPDQKIAFSSSGRSVILPIETAASSWIDAVNEARAAGQSSLPSHALRIFGVVPGSTFESLKYTSLPIERFLVSARDEENVILTFRTQSGGTLRVTPEHPLLGSDGLVTKASFFKVGDPLVKHDGRFDRISSIETSREFGKVYNVAPSSRASTEHIHVAQGFLAGSLALQNGELKDFQRIMSRATTSLDTLELE